MIAGNRALFIRTGLLALTALAGIGIGEASACILGPCFPSPRPTVLPLGDFVIPFAAVGALAARFGARLFPVLPLRGKWAAYAVTLGFALAAIGLWWSAGLGLRDGSFRSDGLVSFLGY